jgi:hypothetical protein
MKTTNKINIFLISSLLLLVPLISTIQTAALQQVYKPTVHMKPLFSTHLDNQPEDEPPQWFTRIYTIIIVLLHIRILFLIPLAITLTDEYWGSFEIKSYFFASILFTLIYRFAFWYVLFHNIAERNNWELPYIYIPTLNRNHLKT